MSGQTRKVVSTGQLGPCRLPSLIGLSCSPIFRRIRRTTISEMTEDRYGLWMGGIYSLFALTAWTDFFQGFLIIALSRREE